jgi:hypothetical protein
MKINPHKEMGGVKGYPQFSIQDGGLQIRSRILDCDTKPFCAGKFGTSEMETLFCALNGISFSSQCEKNMFVNAGLFGSKGQTVRSTLEDWAKYIMDNRHLLDEMVQWNPVHVIQEDGFIRDYMNHIPTVMPLRALEPFYHQIPWTLALQNGLPFCAVSPFKDSIEQQWSKHQFLFPTPIWSMSPDFRGCVATGYSPSLCDPAETCSWSPEIIEKGWFSAVESVVNQCMALGVKFVFVGAGALSLPICFELKKRGISSVHTGGGTQIIFGVRGSRWSNHSVISRFFNQSWVFPSEKEIPSKSHLVEGGCYW